MSLHDLDPHCISSRCIERRENRRLKTLVSGSGLVSAAVQYQYTSDLRLLTVSLAGGTLTDYVYDADGLVTRGGQLALTRDPVTGAITRDSVGVVATKRLYDPHGALQRIDFRVGGTPMF